MSSNVVSYIAKADTAYSVSLTTVSTMLCPFLTPGLTYLLARGTRLDVPVWGMMADLLVMVIVPLFIGFGVVAILGTRMQKVLPVFPALSATFIVFICSLVIALNRWAPCWPWNTWVRPPRSPLRHSSSCASSPLRSWPPSGRGSPPACRHRQ
jgi:predicted Na+-dependent transporter